MLVERNGLIDFENAITMTEAQREEFIEGCRRIFDEVNTKEVDEPPREGTTNKSSNEHWTAEEYAVLIEYYGEESYDQIADRLDGRNARSIKLKGGYFVQKFIKWYSQKYGGKLDNVEDHVGKVKEFRQDEGDA